MNELRMLGVGVWVPVSWLTRALVPVLASILSVGCATSPPSSFYLLTPIPEAVGHTAAPGGAGLTIGIGPVSFPQFLDRPQIVARDGANRLSVDELHRWGGSLQDDFLRVWGENLAVLLETSRVLTYPFEVRTPLDYRILASVLGFEGAVGREAVLKVRWVVQDGQGERVLAVREDRYRRPIAGGGVGADQGPLVAAMSECLGAFSRDVADLVRGLPRPAPLPAAVQSP